jgi:hypothetical protein
MADFQKYLRNVNEKWERFQSSRMSAESGAFRGAEFGSPPRQCRGWRLLCHGRGWVLMVWL